MKTRDAGAGLGEASWVAGEVKYFVPRRGLKKRILNQVHGRFELTYVGVGTIVTTTKYKAGTGGQIVGLAAARDGRGDGRGRVGRRRDARVLGLGVQILSG